MNKKERVCIIMGRCNDFAISKMYCCNCGKEGLPIARKAGRYREAGHLKKLYCIHCGKVWNKELFSMADLFLMSGVSGAGKSTFLKNRVKKDTSVVISRDVIRFSIVKPEEDYFSHEDEVLAIFWKQINEALAAGKNVFVDQTSLTPKARKWLLQHVEGYDHANLIWIDEDIQTCLERNEMRRGTRAYVPRSVIRRMNEQFIEPSLEEGFYRIYRYNSKEDKLSYKGEML